MLLTTNMKSLATCLLILAELEHVSSLMRLPFVKTTPRRRGGLLPGLKTSAPMVDHQHPAASLTPSTAVFGILPSQNPEDWQLLLQSFQDKWSGVPPQDPLSVFTGSLLSQSQALLQDGIQQAAAAVSQAQDELATVTTTLQTGLQDQLSTLETLQSSTQEQISTLSESVQGQVLTLSSSVQGQVSTLSTTVEGLSTSVEGLSTSVQSELVAQWGALTLLWSGLQSSLTVNVQDQVNSLQTGLVEQLAGLALVLKNAEASTASLFQEETSTLFKLLPSLQEQVSGWTAQQQQLFTTWLSSVKGPSLAGADWSAILAQWQGQLSDASDAVKTVVTGLGLVMGAYFVFGPQPEEKSSTTLRAAAVAVAPVPEKSQLDLVLEQVSLVEKEHEELEQAIWQGSPPPVMAAAGATMLEKPYFVDDKPSLLEETIPSPPTPTEPAVIQTYYSSTANYLGSSTIAKGEDVINEDSVVVSIASAPELELAASTIVLEDMAAPEIVASSVLDTEVVDAPLALEAEPEVITASSLATEEIAVAEAEITLATEEIAVAEVEAEIITAIEAVAAPVVTEPEEIIADPTPVAAAAALRLSPTVSYLESLASNLQAAQEEILVQTSQSYLDSLANFQHPPAPVEVEAASTTEEEEPVLPVPELSIESLETTLVQEEVVELEVSASIQDETVEITVDDRPLYPTNADGTKDWPLEVSALEVSAVLSQPVLPSSEALVDEATAAVDDEPSIDLVAAEDSLTPVAEEAVELVAEDIVEPTQVDFSVSASEELPVETLLPTSDVVFEETSIAEKPVEAIVADATEALLPVAEADEENDWAALSDEISSDIWKHGEPANEAIDSTEELVEDPVLAASSDEERDWAGLSDEISSDIWNQEEIPTGDSSDSENSVPVAGSGEPWSAPQDETSSDVLNQGEQAAESTPRVPMTALLSDEDNEIREYIKAKAAQKTRERLQEQVARRNGAKIATQVEAVVTTSPVDAYEVDEVSVSKEVVEEPYIEVAPSIEAREETIAMRIIKNEIEGASPITDLVDVKPRRLQRKNQSKPKVSKKRLLTAVAVVAVVVGQRALTAILNRSLL